MEPNSTFAAFLQNLQIDQHDWEKLSLVKKAYMITTLGYEDRAPSTMELLKKKLTGAASLHFRHILTGSDRTGEISVHEEGKLIAFADMGYLPDTLKSLAQGILKNKFGIANPTVDIIDVTIETVKKEGLTTFVILLKMKYHTYSIETVALSGNITDLVMDVLIQGMEWLSILMGEEVKA